MQRFPNGDEQVLRRRLGGIGQGAEVISSQTAQDIARWLARAVGPGFEAFISHGLVTPAFYRELVRLYDLRAPEAELWLDDLVRYCLTQTTVQALPDAREGEPQ